MLDAFIDPQVCARPLGYAICKPLPYYKPIILYSETVTVMAEAEGASHSVFARIAAAAFYAVASFFIIIANKVILTSYK